MFPLVTGFSKKFVTFELNDLKEQINVIVENKQVQRIQDVNFNFILEREVVVDAKRTDPFEIPKLPKYDVQKIPKNRIVSAFGRK